MSKILIVGGGAAGMLASIIAAREGHKVYLYEKNEKLGKKLYITGKGRCNITNACDMETLVNNIVTNSKFLYSSLNTFNNYDVMQLFESLGLKIKTERGNRVFPNSDKSSDVITVLANEMERLGVIVHFNTSVNRILIKEGKVEGLELKNNKPVYGDNLIIATGGLSYKSTGSTGDGYKFAQEVGHTVTDFSPSLVPFNIKEEYIKELIGLSLKNIRIQITTQGKEVYSDFGEMLFTHFGVSGPLILSASSYIIPYIMDKNKNNKNKDLKLCIDLKSALTYEQLDDRIIRDFNIYKNKLFKNSLDDLLPNKLIPIIIRLSGINPDKKVNSITKEERRVLTSVIKGMEMSIDGLRDYNEAVITRGGINVKEVNPRTMESKLIKNLYFAGEVLDIDGLTGGFNLQIAWTTAYVAGKSIIKEQCT